MNKLIYMSAIVALGLGLTNCKAQIPENISTSFNKMFPNASNVKWDKENSHEYEAEFILNGIKSSASFDNNGEWLETETEIPVTEVSEAVITAFYTQTGKDTKINHCFKIEKKNGAVEFEMEYKSGIKNKEIEFDINGNKVKD